MRKCSLMLVLGFIKTLAVAPFAPAKPAQNADPKPAKDWKEDRVCRMVFFAVLEGLYEDGVSSAAADNVVGKTKDGRAEIKQTFVIQCPLCHPVYEALRLYQQRPRFRDKGNTFGKGLDPKLERDLRSERLRTRQTALQAVVHRWIERRLTGMGLTATEKNDWARRLEERSQQGDALLSGLKSTDPWYRGWNYGFCAACKGCTGVCKALKKAAKK